MWWEVTGTRHAGVSPDVLNRFSWQGCPPKMLRFGDSTGRTAESCGKGGRVGMRCRIPNRVRGRGPRANSQGTGVAFVDVVRGSHVSMSFISHCKLLNRGLTIRLRVERGCVGTGKGRTDSPAPQQSRGPGR